MKNDLFEKCFGFQAASEARSEGLYPYFRPIASAQDTEVVLENGEKLIMMGSNSYLGLVTDERVKKAARDAVEKYGTGNAGSRFLNGNLDIHDRLEKRLAEFLGKEDALLFSAGYLANLGSIYAIAGKNDVLITDRLDHASIIDGCLISGASLVRFKHNDMDHLKKLLQKHRDDNKMIIVDGIFSMEGDIAKLPEIVALAKEYDARVMVDDAHSVGVLGENGRGTANHFGVTDDVDLIMGTFSKSFATMGGYIAGDHKIIDYIRHFSRAEIFTASMPAANVASADAALNIMLSEPQRIERLWEITHKMLSGFKKLGFETGTAETPIIPIFVGDMEKAFKMWKALTEVGLFVNPVIPPAVPPTACLMRTSYMATHTDEQLDFALSAFEKAGKALGIL